MTNTFEIVNGQFFIVIELCYVQSSITEHIAQEVETMNKENPVKNREIGPLDFDSASVINPDGSETAITDEMIEKACDELESTSQKGDKTH